MITSKVNNAALDAFLAALDLSRETLPEPVLNQYRLAMARALTASQTLAACEIVDEINIPYTDGELELMSLIVFNLRQEFAFSGREEDEIKLSALNKVQHILTVISKYRDMLSERDY